MIIKDFKDIITAYFRPDERAFFMGFLKNKADNDPLDEKSSLLIKAIMSKEWQAMVMFTPATVWEKKANLMAYLACINSLTDHQFFSPNERSELIMPSLESEFVKYNLPYLSLKEFLDSLIACARLCGYPDDQETNYPLNRLTQELTAKDVLSNRSIPLKKQTLITRMAVLYYIIQQYFSPEQLQLLKMALMYRKDLTKEEQLAEGQIFDFLTQQTTVCKQLFNDQVHFIDFRIIQDHDDLANLQNLLPQRKHQLVERVIFSKSIWLFLKQYSKADKRDEMALMEQAVACMDEVFFTSPNQTLPAALSFARQMVEESLRLDPKRMGLMQKGILCFTLKEYIKSHTLDNSFHFFPCLSRAKIEVAQKLLCQVKGEAVEFSVMDSLLLKEGRLGQIAQLLPEQAHEHLELTARL